MYWVIIITFAATNVPYGNLDMYTAYSHPAPVYDQVVTDKHNRAVLFNDIKKCEEVAARVIDTMIRNPNVRPLQYRCIRAEVSK